MTKQGLVQQDAILLVQFVVCDSTWRKNADSTVRTLVNLVNHVLIHGFRDFVCHKALPLEEPVGADHVPRIFCLALFLLLRFRFVWVFFTVQFKVENDLLFYFAAQFQGINLISCDFIRTMQCVLIGL